MLRKIAYLVGVLVLSWCLTVQSNDAVADESSWTGPTAPMAAITLPKLPNPFTAVGQGLKKIGDGLASLVPHKPAAPQQSQFYPPGAVKKQEEKRSFFDRLFKPKESPKKIESVYDWMGQEQILP